MPGVRRRITVSTLLFAVIWLVLPACTQSKPLHHQTYRTPSSGVVGRIKPLRFDALTNWLVRVNRQNYKLIGRSRMNGLGLTILLRCDTPASSFRQIAAEYTWAGAHRIIYPHQPHWAVTIVRDVHRVLAFPQPVGINASDGRYGQRITQRQANGDVTTYSFINNLSLPWQINVIRPGGQRIVALLRWTRQGSIKAMRLHDRSNQLELNIRFIYRPELR
jgi:hypothetical protein